MNTIPPYREPSLPVEARVDDLVGRMTVEEKAGQLFQQMTPIAPVEASGTDFALPSVREMVVDRSMTHINLFGGAENASEIARWHNEVQELAASTRLGIPVTIASDPRHHFSDNPGAAAMAGPFSQWPETLGLAAVGSDELVERFADIARQEYLAVGLRSALHPQIDLATEPRWARINGTFGEDADLTSRLAAAYIRGLQGDGLSPTAVAAMPKHFPGGGPQADGEDPHFAYGKDQVYPGQNMAYHLRPFEVALAAGARQIMPYYGRPLGTEWEEVGFGYNKSVITHLLREHYGFDGVVCTDWGLVTDSDAFGVPFPARAWGVEDLSRDERALMILEAGCDQFGGEHCPEVLVDLVRSGRLSVDRIDLSVRRLLRVKFALGLFENPFVSVEDADAVVGCPEFRSAGEAAQRASITVLTNPATGPARLPAGTGLAIYAPDLDSDLVSGFGSPVARPEDADLAILRLKAPYEVRPTPFEQFFHAGRLTFTAEELAPVLAVCQTVPTIVDLYLDRPAIIPELVENAAAVVVNYGASDAALLDVLFGAATPRGRLPFDLPRSTEAVERNQSDVPFDTDSPLFTFGHGLTW